MFRRKRAEREVKGVEENKPVIEKKEKKDGLNIFQQVNGWKTAAAAIYWPVVYQILPLWYPDGLPADVNRVVVTVGIFLTVLGVGHKWYKKTHGGEQ